jgi:hypothetical protein
MAQNDFLSFLVEETLKLHKSGEAQLSSFEHKLSDYGLNFLKGEFVPQIQTLRFTTDFGTLDVPVNWSIFSVESGNGHTVLDEKNDADLFFAVIKKSWAPSAEKILVTHADGFCFIVGFKKGEDSCLRDLIQPQEWLKAA